MVGIPINARQLHILAKRRDMLIGLLEDAMTMLVIIRLVDGIIDAHDHDQRP